MQKIKALIVVFVLMILVSYLFTSDTYADIGPAPIYPQGGTLQSETVSTQVSMDYEKVILSYGNPQRKISADGTEYGTTMPVHVSAVFKMKNNGSQSETMNVYFPASDSTFIGGWGTEELTNFKVNGTILSKDKQASIPVIADGKEEKMVVYQWQETFAPQAITEITVEYDAKSGKDYEVYYLTYVLGTGRNWQGNIRQGEIQFILPETLAPYSILNKAPLVKENKLPYQVNGNTVTVSFSEYEPSADAAIVLGVYEFDLVDKVEQLKKAPRTFTNYLKIAGLYRQLSTGPHCAFCIGVAAEYAKEYYLLALDAASSKEELTSVLQSFTYGDWPNLPDVVTMLTLKDCQNDDLACKAKIYYDYEYLGATPFLASAEPGTIKHSDFLIKFAEKMRPYDPTLQDSITAFISGAKEVNLWRQKNPPGKVPSSITPSPSVIPPSNKTVNNVSQAQPKTYIFLVLGVGIVIIFFIIVFFLIRKRKSISKNKAEITPEQADFAETKIENKREQS